MNKETDMNILLRSVEDCYEIDENGQIHFTFCDNINIIHRTTITDKISLFFIETNQTPIINNHIRYQSTTYNITEVVDTSHTKFNSYAVIAERM